MPETDPPPPFDAARHRALQQLFEDLIPFNRALGMRLHHAEPGRVVSRLPWRDDFIGDPTRPAVHGGITSALVDATGGAACVTLLERLDDRVSTVDLRVDYLRAGRPGDLECVAEVLRMGNRVAVARMEVRSLRDGDEGSPIAPRRATEIIATGQGVYNVIRTGDSSTDPSPDPSRGVRSV